MRTTIDLVLRLREARRISGLTQLEVAVLSGIHEKTISSFETGERIHFIKLEQLRRLVEIYGFALDEFLGESFETRLLEVAAGHSMQFVLETKDQRLIEIFRGLDQISDNRRERLIHGWLDQIRLGKQSEARGMRLVG